MDHLVDNAAHRQQMNLRLLDLDHRAAGVGELVIFLVERIGDREDAIRHGLVVIVLHGEGDDLRRDVAEFYRPPGQPLGGLPHRGVLQIAAADWADDLRHHARFEVVVQDVAARERDAATAGRRLQRVVVIEPDMWFGGNEVQLWPPTSSS